MLYVGYVFSYLRAHAVLCSDANSLMQSQADQADFATIPVFRSLTLPFIGEAMKLQFPDMSVAKNNAIFTKFLG